MMLTISLFALSKKQLFILQEVRDVAKNIPDKRGETYENTLSAICLTESSAGRDLIGDFKMKKITKASLGAMQIQVRTVRFMARSFKELASINKLSDMEIAQRLIQDVRFSAEISAYYMVWLNNSRPTFYSAVSGYNGGMENWPYYKRVMKRLALVKKQVALGLLN
jgi:hypothetical protein